MELTFTKVVPEDTSACTSVCPMTIQGELIEHVTSCIVESRADGLTKMTLTVVVTEELSDQVARRLENKPL